MTIFDLIQELDSNLDEAKKLKEAKKFINNELMNLPQDEAMECILELGKHLKLSRDYKTNLKEHYKNKKKYEIFQIHSKTLSSGRTLFQYWMTCKCRYNHYCIYQTVNNNAFSFVLREIHSLILVIIYSLKSF